MEKVLLIGGYGFFGSNVYASLSEEYSIEVMSRFKHDGTNVQGKDWIEGDITSKSDVERVIGRGYDYIFDFVGLINEKEQKHFDVNIKGMQNIIDAISSTGTNPRVVYISAINAENGTTAYFKTKHDAEKILSSYNKHTIIRPSIIYGKYDFLTLQFYDLIKKTIPVFPKSGIMYPVYVGDIVKVVREKMHQDGAFNVCSEEKLMFVDMFNIFRKKFGKKSVKKAPLKIFKLLAPVLERTGTITSEQIDMLGYDFYRKDSVLKSVVSSPMRYSEFVESLEPRG
jgi:nucleoside-diphosphate-sugar epimerase